MASSVEGEAVGKSNVEGERRWTVCERMHLEQVNHISLL